jgi:hypothetical protein
MHIIRKHGRGWNTSVNFKRKGKRWTPQHRANFSRALKLKKKQKVKSAGHDPGVTFCPRCGCNIRNVAAAIRFGDKQ